MVSSLSETSLKEERELLPMCLLWIFPMTLYGQIKGMQYVINYCTYRCFHYLLERREKGCRKGKRKREGGRRGREGLMCNYYDSVVLSVTMCLQLVAIRCSELSLKALCHDVGGDCFYI